MRTPADISVMMNAAEKAAKRVIRDFGELENLQVSRKGPADFVSAADIRTEKILFEELRKARPSYGFMGEEGNAADASQGSDARFIVDPIDGTTNFLHGIPHFCISIGLEKNGVIESGVILDPIKNEAYWAANGQGAFCNNRRLRVSGRIDMKEALLVTGIPFAGHGNADQFLTSLRAFIPEIAGVRRTGSAALDMAYVAAGRFDAYWEQPIKPWDIAAGIILVREAGGKVSAMDGSEDMLTQGSILATNFALYEAFFTILKSTHKRAA